MKRTLKHIELKSGYSGNGPAWIARVAVSKSGRTFYFDGKALKRGQGVSANHFDLETGEKYWISSVKKDGSDRHWTGSGRVRIEASAVREYLRLIDEASLDTSRLEVVSDFEPTSAERFHHLEHGRL